MKREEFNTIRINCTHIELDVSVETHYTQGYFTGVNNDILKFKKRKYKEPRLDVRFNARVDKELIVGGYYSNGTSNFLAVSKDKIMMIDSRNQTFKFPNEIFLIHTEFDKVSDMPKKS